MSLPAITGRIEGFVVPAFVIDERLRIVAANAAMLAAFQDDSEDDLVSRDADQFIATDDRETARRHWIARFRGETAQTSCSFAARRNTGAWLSLQAIDALCVDDARPVLVIVLLDVSLRECADEDARRREALRWVRALSRAAAHQINNPLAVIMSNCELLAEDVAPLGRERLESMLTAISRIHDVLARMSRITRLAVEEDSSLLPEMLRLEIAAGAGGVSEGEWSGLAPEP